MNIKSLFNASKYEKQKRRKKSPSNGAREYREPKKRIYGQLGERLEKMMPGFDFAKIICYPKTKSTLSFKEEVSLGDVIDALDRASGKMYLAARFLEIRYSTLMLIINEESEIGSFLRELQRSIEGELLDEVENLLIDCCRNLEDWAIKFFLTSQGKERGYSGEQKRQQTVVVIGGEVPKEEYN